jgi:hypothetical protein
MRRTDSRTLASWTASEHEVVVFPTPPLPPQKIHLSDFYGYLILLWGVIPGRRCSVMLEKGRLLPWLRGVKDAVCSVSPYRNSQKFITWKIGSWISNQGSAGSVFATTPP